LICSLPPFAVPSRSILILSSHLCRQHEYQKEKQLKRKDEYQIFYCEQVTELLTFPHSTDIEELRRALDAKTEKVRALEVDLQAAREQDSRYAATVTEEIERGEWSCKINRV
jgi:hypothetical protein